MAQIFTNFLDIKLSPNLTGVEYIFVQYFSPQLVKNSINLFCALCPWQVLARDIQVLFGYIGVIMSLKQTMENEHISNKGVYLEGSA